MRVAVTGSSGFIGSNLSRHIAQTEPDTEQVLIDIVPPQTELPANARFVFADIRNLASLLEPLKGCEEVYHLAGLLGTSELIAVSSLACETNIVGQNNVMDACRITGVRRVYGVAKPNFEGYDENAYTLTKHAGELLGRMYQQKFNMEVATVRWLNAVGASSPHMGQHLYPVRKFVPMMILLGLYDKALQIYGDGTQTIDPIDVEDLSRFTVYACRNLGKHPKVVDLGSGNAINCNDAAEVILNEMRGMGLASQSRIVHVPMREGEKPGVNLVADMSFWHSIGMHCVVPFEVSVRNAILAVMAAPEYHRRNALHFYGVA